MNNLILTVSLALIIGRSPATALLSNATSGLPAANGPSNSTAALNTNLASNATSGSSYTNDTSLMGNSTLSSYSSKTTPQVFLMNEDINWSTSNFSIYDQSGTITYQITKDQEGKSETMFVVQDAKSGVKNLKTDAHVKACGFGQTYEADDGTKFRLDPRAFLSDRWYIKTPASESEYVYMRGALSVEGKIYEKERVVAQVETQTASAVASLSTKQMSLHSDGTIPPLDLIALMAIVKARIHACGY